jgi:lysophospholipid acyltransferase (LPLAT)-like uncharacterized protein
LTLLKGQSTPLFAFKEFEIHSQGEEGRRAANHLAALVRNGYPIAISPDGPNGPARVFKKGVFHVALQSGVPIVLLTISSSRFISWPSWDSKKFPLPFGRVRVVVHDAIRVNHHNFDESSTRIIDALGGC